MPGNEVLRAALVRLGGVLEHLAEHAPDAVTREQARDVLAAPVRAEVERMRVLERMAEAVRDFVECKANDVGVLLEALDELAELERSKEG